jgi:hypothetical protein
MAGIANSSFCCVGTFPETQGENMDRLNDALYEADSYHRFWVTERDHRLKLQQALREIAVRARLELNSQTELRDTAFSLIEKTANEALKD